MSKKSGKGLFYYLGLLISFVFGVCCILIAILIFNPNKDVYGIGIRYTNCSDNMHITSIPVDDVETPLNNLSFNKITLNANFSNFSIGYTTSESMEIYIRPHYVALTKNDPRTYSANVTYEYNEIKIDITEPNLFIPLSRGSKVEIIFPVDYAGSFSNIDFNINSNSGKVTLGDTTTGDYVIKNLNVNTKSGTVNIKENVKVLGAVNIESTKAKVNINTTEIGSLYVKNNTGRIKTGDLNCDVEIDNRKTLEANLGNINGNVKVTSNAGYFKAKQVNNFTKTPQIDSTDKDLTEITLQKVNGNATITTHSGEIKIDEITGKTIINTTSGDVKIGKANSSVQIDTKTGNVELTQNTTSTTTVNTTKGSIKVTFAGTVGAINEFTSTSGTISIYTMGGTPYLLDYTTGKSLYKDWEVEQNSAPSGSISIFGGNQLNKIKAETQGSIKLYSIV